MTICYVGGCGRLGLAMAAWTANMKAPLNLGRGRTSKPSVICADVNSRAVNAVINGDVDTPEPLVAGLVREGARNGLLTATTDIADAVSCSDISVVIVPTPSLPDASFSNEHVLKACYDIGYALRGKTDYHLVIITSTVMPGSCDGPIRRVLEEWSQRPVGAMNGSFGLVYSPEFVRQGSIVEDFSRPDQVLIGASDDRAAEAAWDMYKRATLNSPPVFMMSLPSAEIAKIGLNAAVVMKTIVANQLAMLAHATPGADAHDVLEVVAADPRIGYEYFRAGAWVGGPCFPRDCRALGRVMNQSHVPDIVAHAAGAFSDRMASWLSHEICRITDGSVGVLGLTYKPGVDYLEDSQGLVLARKLGRDGRTVYTHDPSIGGEGAALDDVIAGSKILVIMTAWPQYRERLCGTHLPGKTVFDMWGLLDGDPPRCERYIRFGRNS